MTRQRTEMLEAALAYVQRGWAVFPLHTPRAGGKLCSCRNTDCKNVGKHPRTAHGLLDATTSAKEVERWWELWPDANIGIATGASGLVVIDVDPRHGGQESLDALIEAQGRGILDTLTSLTGGGGQHLVYAAPAGTRIGNVSLKHGYEGPLGIGIDVRGDGGYIVAPPSLHESNDYYEWESDREPAQLPRSIFDALSARPLVSSDATRVSVADILNGVPEGSRDWELFRLAAKLRYMDLPLAWANDLVCAAAEACTPPFPRDQALNKVKSAYKYEPGKGVVAEPVETVEIIDEGTGEVRTELVGRVLLDPVLKEGLPPTVWAVENALVRGRIHLCYGEPESGKTIIALAWMRYVIDHGGTVVFIDEESGVASIVRLLGDMGVKAIDHGLHYFPFLGLTLESREALLAFVDFLRPTLVVFDSLTDMLASAGLDENSGIEVTRWMDDVAQAIARRDYAPAVVLVDHITKDAANTKYAVASRAKKAKADVLWHVVKEEDFDQTKTAGVDLVRHKNRPGVMPKKLRYVVGGKDNRLICEPFDASQHDIQSLDAITKKILQELAKPGSEELAPGVIAARIEQDYDTVLKRAIPLFSAGLLARTGATSQTRYTLTAAGKLTAIGELSSRSGESNSPTNLPDGGVPLGTPSGSSELAGKPKEKRDVWNP